MARSLVTLKKYRYEVRHGVDQVVKTNKVPDTLLNTWVHKDICETILRLGSLVSHLYRKRSTVAISSAAGSYDADVSHTAAATTVTGFSGLVPDAWIGGSIITVKSSVIYCAQITDNDATTITISNGSDLPALSSDPAFLTLNNSQYTVPLTGLYMINFDEPIWEVKDNDGARIEPIDLDNAGYISDDTLNANEAYWTKVGQNVILVAGASKTLSGNVTIGYYELPTEATLVTDYIDFPIEWHDLSQQKTMIRILKKLEQYEKAQERQADLEKKWQEIESSNMRMRSADVMSGERKRPDAVV